MTAASEPLTANEANTARRRGLTLIAAAVAIAALGWGGWHWANGRHVETTDNAYVAGNVVQITPQVGGTVVSIGSAAGSAPRIDGMPSPTSAAPEARACSIRASRNCSTQRRSPPSTCASR